MNSKLVKAIGMVAVLATVLVGCKEIDKDIVNATKVNGTYNLWWFCDGTTLIYFEDMDGDDEYIAMFSWGCDVQGKPTKELPGTLGDDNGGDNSNG